MKYISAIHEQRSKLAERKFYARIAELGGTVLELVWLGIYEPHKVRCRQGHKIKVKPCNIKSDSKGFCSLCQYMSPARMRRSLLAETKFRGRIAELGGTVLEPVWLGIYEPHKVRCRQGHEVEIKPSYYLYQGEVFCPACRGNWTIFYVLVNDEKLRVKIGISSGTGKRRLKQHRQSGYTRVVRWLEDLPDNVAPKLEKYVLKQCRKAEIYPVQGIEYFDLDDLTSILEITDGYLKELSVM